LLVLYNGLDYRNAFLNEPQLTQELIATLLLAKCLKEEYQEESQETIIILMAALISTKNQEEQILSYCTSVTNVVIVYISYVIESQRLQRRSEYLLL
jgi:hypothetical protein